MTAGETPAEVDVPTEEAPELPETEPAEAPPQEPKSPEPGKYTKLLQNEKWFKSYNFYFLIFYQIHHF